MSKIKDYWMDLGEPDDQHEQAIRAEARRAPQHNPYPRWSVEGLIYESERNRLFAKRLENQGEASGF